LPPIEECDPASFVETIENRDEPAVFRGLVSHWPIVAAGRSSTAEIADYLKSLESGATIRAFVGEPQAGGRFFYNDDLSRFNFHIAETKFAQLIATLVELATSGTAQPIYMGSTLTSEILPRFAAENPLTNIEQRGAPRIWIGNSSRVAAHFDQSDNVACVASGRRRFVVFPTEQVDNLYVGPLDTTVAGQPTSLVDLAAPDFERFPKFREALKHARTAELGPGDAIYIPALWWHAVEATGDLNVLVNYWWQDEPVDDSPFHALGHALLSVGHLSRRKRERWGTLFDHYAFHAHGDPAEHIPEHARGILATSTAERREFLRQFLIARLMGK
jgi:hypothetical protein